MRIQLIFLLAFFGTVATDASDFLPRTHYTVASDAEFQEFGFLSTLNLETFESGEISKPGMEIVSNDPWSIKQGFSVPTDAADNSGFALEATHSSCAASFPPLCPATVTLQFDRTEAGTLPSYVGFVWTDAVRASTDSAFPFARVTVTNSLGEETSDLISSSLLAEGLERPSDDDVLIRLVDDVGVSSVRISVITDGTGRGGHFAVDHVQYGTAAIPGDADLDGDVDFADFTMLSSSFGSTDSKWSQGDFDFDQVTGFPDFLLMSKNFGESISAPSAIPEPTSSLLILMGAGCFMLRCRRRR